MALWWAITRTWCLVLVCLCCVSGGVRGSPEGVRGVDTEKGVQTIVGNNGPQSLESVLYSIEERLRGLDLVYAPRPTAPPRLWDAETSARRLDAVDARLARVEALLELRLDKVVEAVNGNHMSQTLSNDQLARKIENLHDRLSLRIEHLEQRLDSGVENIQSSIARTKRDADNSEADFETQLFDLQKQFDGFESTQNATVAALAELSGNRCKRGELNDAQNVVKDFTRQDVDEFAASMENVATKVNKMVADFGQRTQSMESLVKNAMSLANATRRELQDGLRTLGLRIVHHGTKHNKEKETSFENGWDALAALVVREFGNLSNQLTKGHDALATAQDDFRNSCYRLQEQDQQLSGHIANILDKTLDITDNRSQEVAKRLGTLGEIIKSHGSQSRDPRLDSRDRSVEMMPQRLDAIDDVLKVIKKQVGELAALNAAADRASPSTESRQAALEETSRLVSEKVIAFLNATRNEDKAFPEDEEFLHLEEYASKPEKGEKAGKRKSFLDIAEEELGETLEYNVTEDVERKATEGKSRKEVAGESSEFEFDKSQAEGDAEYDDDEDGMEEVVETSETLVKKGDKEVNARGVGRGNETAVDPSIGGDIRESGHVGLSAERNQGGVASTEVDSGRDKGEYVEGDKTNSTSDVIDPAKFSDYWNRMRNVNGSDLSVGSDVIKVDSKGRQSGGKVRDLEKLQRRADGFVSADDMHLGLDDHVNINHDEDEYDYGD